MTSLLDIVPADASKETVTIRGQKLEVYGISLLNAVKLLKRFPDLGSVLIGQVGEIAPDRMVQLVPEAATAIIATGLGHGGEQEYEDAAGRLGVEEQIDVFTAVMKLTLPSGVGPFVEKLNLILGAGGGGVRATPDQDTKSPKPLNGSSPPVIEPQTSGDIPISN